MTDIDKYIEQLKSPDKNKRYDACEELRLASNLPEKAILTLQETTNDSDALVAEAAQRALALHTPQLTQNEVDIVDEKSDNEIAGKENRLMILIRAILLIFGTLFILFKVQEFWESFLGQKIYLIWFYPLTGTVLVGLIYYLDTRIIINKSKVGRTKTGSSAYLISALGVALGIGIPACLATLLALEESLNGVIVLCAGLPALIGLIGALILLYQLSKLLS